MPLGAGRRLARAGQRAGRVARGRARHRVGPQRPHRELVVAGQHRGVGRGLGHGDRLGDPSLHEQRVGLEHEQTRDERALTGRLRQPQRPARVLERVVDALEQPRPPARGTRATSMCSASCSSDSVAHVASASRSSARSLGRRFTDVLARLHSAPRPGREQALVRRSCARFHTSRATSCIGPNSPRQ